MTIIEAYHEAADLRQQQGIPPLPLSVDEVTAVIEHLPQSQGEERRELLFLLRERVNPGVDEAAGIKADFLAEVIAGRAPEVGISPLSAVQWLGMMRGGYNLTPLLESMDDERSEVAAAAIEALKHTLLVYDAFAWVVEKFKKGHQGARQLLESWAQGEWFSARPELPQELRLTVFKVPGETNTDDLSPASEASSRSDIPLHAKALLAARIEEPLAQLEKLRALGQPLAYVGDVVGTGSSRKSAINSLQWHLGSDLPGVPNKRGGGIIIGSIIAPIFFNTAEDSGALPIEAPVKDLKTGDLITLRPYAGEIEKDGRVVSRFKLQPNTLADEYRAGGRIPLLIGRELTSRARRVLGLKETDLFVRPLQPEASNAGYTLAQKIVGRACGREGVRPGMYVEPMVTTVGSQDTTGPMTRDEIKELAALNFSADLVMQSFCHTAAYPQPVDVAMHHQLPGFIRDRSGVSLKPGDGVIHSWLNRLLLPDTLGTGADSHTRFPLGLSFPAGSGLVAFAAVSGLMPLDMPESVLVRFSGQLQPGITLRDLVNAIPLVAIEKGLLTVAKEGKKNIFAGRILEIQGLEELTCEQAFELSDASAERSAAACTVQLGEASVAGFLASNAALIDKLVGAGYGDAETLKRRARAMRDWLAEPKLLRADNNAEYAAVLEIDMSLITEPILACPNDPDDVATLSNILSDEQRLRKIDEVFVGSCMTNIGHFRAVGEILKDEGQVPVRLWLTPPTRMDAEQLRAEGYYSLFGKAGARIEIPGCSLCMGNQARVADAATVFSTSTRNFDNRLGNGAKVYLGSAEMAAVAALLGRLPTVDEYHDIVARKLPLVKHARVYRYLDFASPSA
ncbi:MAG: bifunctional aconitate hydratase 2/2-methylisocitrate dehydratase [Deltaproteobacteria bacterium]|nr:bifunctional aconitate hydratase 2/2-methylisocitrate dehydratase [Deltaproteobacteria bacterium]